MFPYITHFITQSELSFVQTGFLRKASLVPYWQHKQSRVRQLTIIWLISLLAYQRLILFTISLPIT